MVSSLLVAENLTPGLNDTLAEAEPRPLRWTTEQFQRLGDTGVFDGQRVALIRGEIISMMTLGSRHVTGVLLVTETLREVFTTGYVVRSQAPLNLNDDTDPEPDVAVVEGTIRRYTSQHPTTAQLVVEVSDSTLRYDRNQKASIYAQAGIQDYWILNLNENQLEVYRQPEARPEAPYGHAYADVTIYTPADRVVPLALPNSALAVADLLP